MQEVLQMLSNHQLRNTAIRREMLALFLASSHALSHSHIESRLVSNFDRVTLYRTLKTFEEKGLIHRIANDRDTIEYALCKDDCHEHEHKHLDNHAHFRCNKCQHTFCLEELSIPKLPIPVGFKASEFQLLVVGICAGCGE
jgi:Fur family ferric uptake transcriptional regulator